MSMKLDEWIAPYRLNTKLEEYLKEFGVEVVEDLNDLFADAELLQKCKSGMPRADRFAFVIAYKAYHSKDSVSVGKGHAKSPIFGVQDKSRRSDSRLEGDYKRKRKISALDKKLTASASLDLLVMLDCTGSMQSYIDAAKKRIRTFVKTIGEIYPDIPLRIGFIGYRDHRDGFDRLIALPFQPDLAVFERQLGEVCAFGGGDPLTDLTGALKLAAEQDWSSAIRVLFHIGDYPCHGLEYHANLYNEYPRGDPNGLQPCEYVGALYVTKVNYFFGQLTHHTDKMIALFNKRVGCEYIQSAPMNSTTMMEVITSSISSLLSTSLSSSSNTESSHSLVPRECTLVPDRPKWYTVSAERALSFALLPVLTAASLSDDEAGPERVVNDFPEAAHVFVKSAKEPFGKGRSKLAYFAQSSYTASKVTECVLKQSVYASKTYATKEKFEEYLAPQRAALFLAEAYNKVRPPHSPSIEFVAARLLQFLARPDKPYFIEETYIPGEWERYNNNTGYCAPFPTPQGTDHRALQAFSHWTCYMSEGKLMITDCQGCFDAARNAFVLTDPAVHSVSLLAYGGTNMGKVGIERFFKTHRCNDICRALSLPASAVETA